MLKGLVIALLSVALAMNAVAQDINAHGADTPAVMAQLNDSSSRVTVLQPAALESRLAGSNNAGVTVTQDDGVQAEVDNAATSRHQGGYRIQVFSDNNQRTAKNEARAKARLISEAFPELATYVVFNSPFWRLKVGDFRTQADAEDVANMIRHHFPSMASETRVVRDRINVRR